MYKANDRVSIGVLKDNYDADYVGAWIKIDNLIVKVRIADRDEGYVVDAFNSDETELLDTMTIWKDELEDYDE